MESDDSEGDDNGSDLEGFIARDDEGESSEGETSEDDDMLEGDERRQRLPKEIKQLPKAQLRRMLEGGGARRRLPPPLAAPPWRSLPRCPSSKEPGTPRSSSPPAGDARAVHDLGAAARARQAAAQRARDLQEGRG